jgi:hypothetical protein
MLLGIPQLLGLDSTDICSLLLVQSVIYHNVSWGRGGGDATGGCDWWGRGGGGGLKEKYTEGVNFTRLLGSQLFGGKYAQDFYASRTN